MLAELFLDLWIIKSDEKGHTEKEFHYMSLVVLIFFMLEIFFKIFVFCLEFS